MSDPTALHQFPSVGTGEVARIGRGPGVVVVSGGRPGVGATALAVGLATALAQEALRVVLIDADVYGADIAPRCNLAGGLGIDDVLAGRKNIHEALQRGPAGMQVLTGAASAAARSHLTQRSMQRLIRQMQTLAPHADWLLIDAGNQATEFMALLWSLADRLFVVTSPDAVAVMDTYALLKTLLSRQSLRRPPALLVSDLDEAVAADVHRRIDRSCQRFLGLTIEFAGSVPRNRVPARSGESGIPLAASLAHLIHGVFESRQWQDRRPLAA